MAIDAALDSLVELPREEERLEVEANLGVEIDGQNFAVSSEGDRIVVHAPSVAACLAVLQSQGEVLPKLAEMLDTAGVTVEVRTGEAVLAVVGAAASSGRLTRALVSAGVELRVRGIFSGFFRFR